MFATNPDQDLPSERNARVFMLQEGYSTVMADYDYEAEGDAHVGPSIGLIIDGDAVVVIDPGFVADRGLFLKVVEDCGVTAADVTDVVFSHHHPDHTLNAALFPAARIHDHWAIYRDDVWHAREADLASVSPSIRLIRTPGHTPEDITTLVSTEREVYAFTHAWATRNVPVDQPGVPDTTFLSASRRRILNVATVVVPGHASPFTLALAPPHVREQRVKATK